MNKYDYITPPMTFSYSSTSNESEHNTFHGQIMTPVGEFVLDFPSSYGSDPGYWSLSSSSVDDYSYSMPVDMQEWPNTPTLSPSFEYVPSAAIPVPRTYPGAEASCLESHSFDDELMAPHAPASASIQSSSPPCEKPSRSCYCPTCGKTFTRVADVRRHQSTVHDPKLQDCPMGRCPRKGKNGFSRVDHLKEHLRSYHHMPIAKRVLGKRKIKEEGTESYPAPLYTA